MTATEELALVDAAITKILTAGIQSYGTNNRNANFIEYRALTQRKKELQDQIVAETGNNFFAAQFRNPE